MQQSRIPVRYAKAIFQLAKDQEILDDIRNDISLILNTCNASKELTDFLASPIISSSEKENALMAIFANQTKEATHRFFKLITTNKREVYLQDICRNFIDMFKKHKGIVSVSLTTAQAISQEIKQKIIDTIHSTMKAEIEIEEKVNNDLIGGMILRIDDMQYDASIATKLRQAKKDLINESFESRFIKTTD
ncbi:MAG: ATP synthase F1 subunit delta [Marinilabiliales bacterium]|nr:MAG: ATP synthase F1 subunit delta [Marinilabiliales bacterium]